MAEVKKEKKVFGTLIGAPSLQTSSYEGVPGSSPGIPPKGMYEGVPGSSPGIPPKGVTQENPQVVTTILIVDILSMKKINIKVKSQLSRYNNIF